MELAPLKSMTVQYSMYFTKIGYTVKGGSGMRANILAMPNSQVPQNGAGMYPSRDVTFNYRVSYARVKRPISVLCVKP